MSEPAPLDLDCASCGAVQAKLGKTNCTAGEAQGAPPRPGRCPTGSQPEIVGGALDALRGEGDDAHLARIAAQVEGLCYENARARWTRVEDTIAFARLMGYRRIGIATCVGLLEETARLVEILEAQGLVAVSVCCKSGSTDKTALGIPDAHKIRPGQFEPACNPIAQARLLAEAGTQLNVIVGLCVGHDALFAKHSAAPVTTLIAKDRATGHNPVAALYGRHYYRRLRAPFPVADEEGR